MIDLSEVMRGLRREHGIPPGGHVPHQLVAEEITRRLLEAAADGVVEHSGRGGGDPTSG